MAKKVNYKNGYFEYFGISKHDFCIDEYEYIVNDRMVEAVNIHHILFGASKYDDINNWMALSYDNHAKAHNEELKREYLLEIHLKFLESNPY